MSNLFSTNVNYNDRKVGSRWQAADKAKPIKGFAKQVIENNQTKKITLGGLNKTGANNLQRPPSGGSNNGLKT